MRRVQHPGRQFERVGGGGRRELRGSGTGNAFGGWLQYLYMSQRTLDVHFGRLHEELSVIPGGMVAGRLQSVRLHVFRVGMHVVFLQRRVPGPGRRSHVL
jgi:hypothetical protein